jgi:nicotinate-nucleotide--dimethylbenzimidazole phosphoribosyltransferase
MEQLQRILNQIALPDFDIQENVLKAWDQRTKPPGSLGRLERLVAQIAGINGQIKRSLERQAIIVMCGDHGVVREGVSAYPQNVTQLMMDNFVGRQGAAINVLARLTGAALYVVDVGTYADHLPEGVIKRKVRMGAGNIAVEAAMSREEAVAAILQGVATVDDINKTGVDIIALGEMGIGNTTPSAAMIAAFTGQPAETVVGRGTGVNDEGLSHKVTVIKHALSLHHPQANDPLDVLAKVGGLEIAGLAGVIFGASVHRIPVVIDGVITAAAALFAVEMKPEVKHYLIPSHLSREPAHRIVLDHLNMEPIIDLGMCLGEGTGAALVLPMLKAGIRLFHEMATFADLGL